jgi:hypothetical protein
MTSTNRHLDEPLTARAATDGPPGGWLRKTLRAVREFRYDASRFLGHSAAVSPRRLASLRALVTMDAHRIEKGLSVPSPRPWFGRPIVERLVHNCVLYGRVEGDAGTIGSAIHALGEYIHRHTMAASPAPAWTHTLMRDLAELEATIGHLGPSGGTTKVAGATLSRAGRLPSLDFFRSRHSIRDFASEPVTWTDIETAVQAAQHSPSVCNRQSWRVHAFPRGPMADAVLACQNGNAGFGHTASHVLLITVDLRTFVYLGERNQAWIDGGMFAMSLVYALHAMGLGTCCLNWSVDSQADRRLRKVAVIPDWESVIMMLAVGRFPETLRVARSWRGPTNDALCPGVLRGTEPPG